MNGHSIDTIEATEHLKNILKVGNVETVASKLGSTHTENKGEMANVDGTFSNEVGFQKIELSGTETAVSVYGNSVSICSSPMQSGANCSSIMIDNVVDYGWEQKYHFGRLISLHVSKKYLAYSIAPVSADGFVRVIKCDKDNTNKQVLIKGFHGCVRDLSFCRSSSTIFLGCVDAAGDLFIYEITEDFEVGKPNELISKLCLHLVRHSDGTEASNNRIIWCPYVPEGNDVIEHNPDESKMFYLLVVTHNENAEIWNIDALIKEYGKGKLFTDRIKHGIQLRSEHSAPISDATFSPDGIAFATASLDGEIKFFQVNTQENCTPKYLHQWKPHDGRPLSALFFLDNHKDYTPDVQFWKHAITGADNNQEIKVWSCKTWSCLQTLRFRPNPTDGLVPSMKAELDLSAEYLFLSDISRKVLYIMKISLEGDARVTSLSEFGVKYPVLSFSVVDVEPCKRKSCTSLKNSDEEDMGNDEREDEESDSADPKNQLAQLIKIFWIQPKSLQFCRIIYSFDSSPLYSLGSVSSSQDSFVYRDGLSDLVPDVNDSATVGDILTGKCQSPGIPSPVPASLSHHNSSFSEILLTPKDFTSPTHSNLSSVITNTFKLPSVDESTPCLNVAEATSEHDETISTEGNILSRRKSSQHSSTSSPSREVAEILSPGQSLNHTNEITNSVGQQEGISNLDTVASAPLCELHLPKVYHSSEWTKIPDQGADYRTARSESDIPIISREQLKSNHLLNLNEEGTSPDLVNVTNIKRLEKLMESMAIQVSSMAEVLNRQHQAILYIQDDIRGLQTQQEDMQKNLQSLDSVVSNKMDQNVVESSTNLTRLENLLNIQDDKESMRHEQMVSTLTHNVVTGIKSQMDKSLKAEVQNTVMPQLFQCLETLVGKLQGEFLQKVNATDSALKECVGKHLKSKAFCDALSQSLAAHVQQSIQAACKEAFQSSAVPAFDKSCQVLFSQLNEIFVKGTVDYLHEFERHKTSLNSNWEELMAKANEELNKLVAVAVENASNMATQKLQESMPNTSRLQEHLTNVVRQTVRNTIKEQAAITAASNSRAPTPHNDQRVNLEHILNLAKMGEINNAFQEALSASDVKLVLRLCESVSIDQVFAPEPCPLGQDILLSLIHQLSADLHDKTELKIMYIEDAIANLDQNSPVTKEHVGTVLSGLQHRINLFLARNPMQKNNRQIKRIIQSVDSLLKSQRLP